MISILSKLSCKQQLNSQVFVAKITTLVLTILRPVAVSLLLYSPILHKRQDTMTLISQCQPGNKVFITSKRWFASMVLGAQAQTDATTKLTGDSQLTFIHHKMVCNISEEDQFNFRGTITTVHSRKFLLKAHMMRRCTCLKTPVKQRQVDMLLLQQASGFG